MEAYNFWVFFAFVLSFMFILLMADDWKLRYYVTRIYSPNISGSYLILKKTVQLIKMLLDEQLTDIDMWCSTACVITERSKKL